MKQDLNFQTAGAQPSESTTQESQFSGWSFAKLEPQDHQPPTTTSSSLQPSSPEQEPLISSEVSISNSSDIIKTIPTLLNIPQETRDIILSYLLPRRDFETCSKSLCIPRFLPDDDVLKEGILFSIRAVNRDLHRQCLTCLLKQQMVYIDPEQFFITLPTHANQPETSLTPSTEILPLIRNVFITDKHIRDFSNYTSLSRLTGVRAIHIEHDMTKTAFERMPDIRNLVGSEMLNVSDRDDIKSQLVTLSILKLSILSFAGGFLDLRELLGHGLGLVVGSDDDARGQSIIIHIRCPRCQCEECCWIRKDPEGGDSTVTITYDWDSQAVLDTFWQVR